jgi:hypothetical protein
MALMDSNDLQASASASESIRNLGSPESWGAAAEVGARQGDPQSVTYSSFARCGQYLQHWFSVEKGWVEAQSSPILILSQLSYFRNLAFPFSSHFLDRKRAAEPLFIPLMPLRFLLYWQELGC